jgi:hypothetical protein
MAYPKQQRLRQAPDIASDDGTELHRTMSWHCSLADQRVKVTSDVGICPMPLNRTYPMCFGWLSLLSRSHWTFVTRLSDVHRTMKEQPRASRTIGRL